MAIKYPDPPTLEKEKPKNLYPRSGPIRGLIRYVRLHYGENPDRECSGRGLLYVTSNLGKRTRGICGWCGQPAPSKRHLWHPLCNRWYYAATGMTYYDNDDLLKWERKPGGWLLCAECKVEQKYYYEIDHTLALSIAWELRRLRYRKWYRAWTPTNLRLLCRECHREKTRADRAELAKLQVS